MKLFSLFIFCLFSLTSGNTYSKDSYKHEGKLKVAVDTTYPPMEFESEDGTVIGFDVDLAKELAKRLGTEAEFVVMPWDGILAGLMSKRYDIIMSSMNITAERKKQVNFVEYVKMGQVFVTRKKDGPINNENQLANKVVSVQADTTSFEAVEGFKKSGIAIKEIKAFKGATDTFSALKSMQADVIVIDEPVGKYYAAKDAGTFLVSGEAIKPEPIGIAIPKKETKLRNAIKSAIKAMKKDKTFQTISKKWFN